MGRQPKIDWSMAFHAYVSGKTLQEIADEFGVALRTVKTQSAQNDWSLKRREIKESQLLNPPNESIEAYKHNCVSRWIRGIIGHLQKLTAMAGAVELRPKVSDLIKNAQLLESLVRSGRLMFELDKDTGSQAPRLGISVHGNASITIGSAQSSVRRALPEFEQRLSKPLSEGGDQQAIDTTASIASEPSEPAKE